MIQDFRANSVVILFKNHVLPMMNFDTGKIKGNVQFIMRHPKIPLTLPIMLILARLTNDAHVNDGI